MIKLADLIVERKVDGMVFVNKWKKALKLLKQKGGWSPHFRKGSEPVGYTNSDILGKIPKRFEDKSWFAFHAQAMSRAMSSGGRFWEDEMTLSWDGDIRLLTGISVEGELLGVRVINHKETPGLGDKIETRKSDWIKSFTGLSLNQPEKSKWKVKRDGGFFDQFTNKKIFKCDQGGNLIKDDNNNLILKDK